MVNLSVELGGVRLDNPVIPASGTFGYGAEFARLYDINILGSFSMKGTTLEPRYGNETPRIAECPSGLLNSVGLQNPGVKAVVETELPRIATFFKKPLIANVCGFSLEEYVAAARAFDECGQVGILEINISCPNVNHGGMSFGADPERAAEVTRAVKAATTKPVFMKLTPNVGDIVAIAKACEDAGADGLALINTLLGMRIDTKKRGPVLANVRGGLSGPAVFPVALRMVYDVCANVKIPIIGMGGISSAADVVEMIMAGASAVEIGSANLRDPYVCKTIIEELPRELMRLGTDNINEIKGAAQK